MKGVVSYLELIDDESIRLVMDDVALQAAEPMCWSKKVLFTHKDYNSRVLKGLGLSKDQYAEIGENLIMRLLALKSGGV